MLSALRFRRWCSYIVPIVERGHRIDGPHRRYRERDPRGGRRCTSKAGATKGPHLMERFRFCNPGLAIFGQFGAWTGGRHRDAGHSTARRATLMRPPLKSTIRLPGPLLGPSSTSTKFIVRTTKAFVRQRPKMCYLPSRNVLKVQWRGGMTDKTRRRSGEEPAGHACPRYSIDSSRVYGE